MSHTKNRDMTDKELVDAIRKSDNHPLKEILEFALGGNKYKAKRMEFFDRNKEKWKKIILNGEYQ